jgi:HNH endonuclease
VGYYRYSFRCRTFVDDEGYLRFKDTGELVHRKVAEKKLGHPLRAVEVVHHRDRDKLDNRPENLWVFSSHRKHNRAHRKDLKRTGYW